MLTGAQIVMVLAFGACCWFIGVYMGYDAAMKKDK